MTSTDHLCILLHFCIHYTLSPERSAHVHGSDVFSLHDRIIIPRTRTGNFGAYYPTMSNNDGIFNDWCTMMTNEAKCTLCITVHCTQTPIEMLTQQVEGRTRKYGA